MAWCMHVIIRRDRTEIEWNELSINYTNVDIFNNKLVVGNGRLCEDIKSLSSNRQTGSFPLGLSNSSPQRS